MQQTTDALLLVRPYRFRKNEQTAVNNYFQEDIESDNVNNLAKQEFDTFVQQLQQHGVNTVIVQDTATHDTPDSIFPNNCISFHGDTAILYPMFAKNRRLERELDVLSILAKQRITFEHVIDYTFYEQEHLFLESTGCLILDRENRIAYCSLSPRADAVLIHRFCLDMAFTPFIFQANQTVDGLRMPIYHTNVMMAVGRKFAVVCLESIDNSHHRHDLLEQLEKTGKEVIEISEEQVNEFAGNILEVKSKDGNPLIVMSSRAYHSFTNEQVNILSKFGKIVHSPLPTIETCGGGSARCMIAEVFQREE